MKGRSWVLSAILASIVVVSLSATMGLLWSMGHCRPGLAWARDSDDHTTMDTGQPRSYLPLVLRESPADHPPTAVNEPPVVDAGTSQTVTLSLPALLDGTVSDDGLPDPAGTLTTTWSRA
ncbi:MAG: hypothetical protein ACK2VA_00355, partial [Anaerolineae bacterium]